MERYTDTISGEELYVYVVSNNSKYYYKDKAKTIRHRLDGPAVEGIDGYKAWYVDGNSHRLDGPAYEYASGYKAWFVDGKRHRSDGPAVEDAYGREEWWVNGRDLSEEEFNALSEPVELTLEAIAAKFGVDVSKIKIVK